MNQAITVGKTFGKLVIVGQTGHGGFVCRCDCGKEVVRYASNLLRGRARSCGCSRYASEATVAKAFASKKDTSLTFIGLDPNFEGTSRKWLARCKCGKVISLLRTDLMKYKSCGCERLSRSAAARKKPDAGMRELHTSYRNSAKNRGLSFELDFETFKEMTQRPCYYCGIDPCRSKKRVTYNGIDRRDNSLGYVSGNLVTCCTACNYAKRDMSEADFLCWIQRAFLHLNLEVVV